MPFKCGPIKQGFALAKPRKPEAYKESELNSLETEGRLIITRKRDGYKLFAVVTRGGVRLFTVGLNEVDDRLAHIKSEIASLNLPPNTVLALEAIFDRDDKDDYTLVTSVFKASLKRAMDQQEKYGKLKAMVLAVVFNAGYPAFKMECFGKMVLERVPAMTARAKKPLIHVFPITTLEMNLADAKKLVKQNGWEGLVLYDGDARGSFREDGKDPERPKGFYKWKPVFEDDFIVREWIGKDDNPKELKEVPLFQINPKTGKEFECGRLPCSGFTACVRKHLTERARYPLVVQVEFEMRFPKSGKIRHPRFVRFRAGTKKVKECVAPKSYAAAEYQS